MGAAAKEPILVDAFKRGEDVYRKTAKGTSRITGESIQNSSGSIRQGRFLRA